MTTNNVLIGCECSGVLRRAFRDKGYTAYSCDLKPTEDNREYHIQGDVWDAILIRPWDLIVLHPDCTAMCVSGNRHYAKGTEGYQKRLDALEWTLDLWGLATKHCNRVAMENPVSVLFTALKKNGVQVCYVQPWEHGHGETKNTGFALHNLPPLVPSNIVAGRDDRIHKMGPGPERATERSRTYTGIANAIVDQWGKLL
jgi:hypothetical protein